ncbi:MAG: hypothetical protein GDA67_04655 [Nitrospira sp. CR1.3]|nr:hypothetical protein [Nitrospira sp. CR1.3]
MTQDGAFRGNSAVGGAILSGPTIGTMIGDAVGNPANKEEDAAQKRPIGEGKGQGATPGPSQPAPLPKLAPNAKPDLTVRIVGVQCSAQNGMVNLQATISIDNLSGINTWKEVYTQVLLRFPGSTVEKPFIGTPYIIRAQLLGGKSVVVTKGITIASGTYAIFVKTDWTNQQPEANEENNASLRAVTVGTHGNCVLGPALNDNF